MARFVHRWRRRRRKRRSPPRNSTGRRGLLIPGCADITHARSVDTLLAHLPPKDGEVGTVQSCVCELSSNKNSTSPQPGKLFAPTLRSLGSRLGFVFFFFFLINLFEIYLLAVQGLCCWARAFSNCGEQGLLNRGVPASHCAARPAAPRRLQELWLWCSRWAGSVVVAHGLG